MKTIRIILAAIVMLCVGVSVSAQDLSKEELQEVKKQATALEKEGWKVKPGSMSLYSQQLRAVKAQKEEDADGMNKWIFGEASSVSNLYDTAKLSALTIAKNNLVKSVTQNATLSNDNEMSNNQSKAEGQANVEEVGKQVSVDVQSIRTKTLVECYRETSDGKIEVRIVVAMPANLASKLGSSK